MDISNVWLDALHDVLRNGDLVCPRGKMTKEIQQRTIVVDTRRPVLRVPARNINHRFMAAEAYWILSGDDRVATIEPYNKNIAAFSDDGVRFFGAYGPKIIQQLPYIIKKLNEDESTRQAGLTIWRECPPATKDVPCTVAIFFSIRAGFVNIHVFMRSSDLWLGVPYDVFNFSMLCHLVCGYLNQRRPIDLSLKPGKLFLTAASSHLYETNWEAAEQCLSSPFAMQPETPHQLWINPSVLMGWLCVLRYSKTGEKMRWWEDLT